MEGGAVLRISQTRNCASLRVAGVALLGVLLVVTFFTCAGGASAQAPPDGASAQWAGGHSVNVIFVACQVSRAANCACPAEGGTDCYPNNDFSIYRNPPGFTQLLVAGPEDANVYQHTYLDVTVTPGQTYTYMVCGGGYANSSKSNCVYTKPVTVPNPPPPPPAKPTVKLTSTSALMPSGEATMDWTSTNATSLDLEPGIGKVAVPAGSTNVDPAQTTTYTITATGPGGTATANLTLCGPVAPPQNLSVLDVFLKWSNPVQPSCQEAPTDIRIFRQSPPSNLGFIALLPSSNGILPNRYTDEGIYGALPHSPNQYLVCEGPSSDGSIVNCAWSVVKFTWGADPVLTATRVNATTVQLKIVVDEIADVSAISVTRQGSDDPCRQGQNLGNGLQGCPTVGQYGQPVGHTDTVYNWISGSGSGPSLPKSAPYLINIPDDTTVKPGVEYYYVAHVGWGTGSMPGPQQDSATVTVPTAFGTVEGQQALAGGIKPLKLSGGAPPPPSGSRVATATMLKPTSHTVTSASSSPMTRPVAAAAPPRAAQSIATRPMTTAASPMMSSPASMPAPAPAAQTASAAAPTEPSLLMKPASPMLTAESPTMSSAGGAGAPPLAQRTTTARLAAAPMKTSTARTVLPVRRVAPVPGAANLAAALKEVQQKPRDPQALYALGKAYCASRLRDTGVSYMYMALLLAENAGNAPLAAQIRIGLAEQGVSAK